MKILIKILDCLSLCQLVLISGMALTCFPVNIYAILSMFLAYGLVMVFAYMHKDRKQRYFPSLLRMEMLMILTYITYCHVYHRTEFMTVVLLSIMFGSTLILDETSQK